MTVDIDTAIIRAGRVKSVIDGNPELAAAVGSKTRQLVNSLVAYDTARRMWKSGVRTQSVKSMGVLAKERIENAIKTLEQDAGKYDDITKSRCDVVWWLRRWAGQAYLFGGSAVGQVCWSTLDHHPEHWLVLL